MAIKRIDDVFRTKTDAKRTLREICILRQCDHKNICKLRYAADFSLIINTEMYLFLQVNQITRICGLSKYFSNSFSSHSWLGVWWLGSQQDHQERQEDQWLEPEACQEYHLSDALWIIIYASMLALECYHWDLEPEYCPSWLEAIQYSDVWRLQFENHRFWFGSSNHFESSWRSWSSMYWLVSISIVWTRLLSMKNLRKWE